MRGGYLLNPLPVLFRKGEGKMDEKEMLAFYSSQLQDDFFPYWRSHYDNRFGGVLNCLSNQGDRLLSSRKFTWSEGRYLWILCKLYGLAEKGILSKLDSQELLTQIHGTKDFLVQYCIGPEEKCHFLLSRRGRPVLDERVGRSDTSIFADCFAVIGLAAYGTAFKDKTAAGEAKALFDSVRRRVEQGDYLTEPYPVPGGYRVHSVPMILIHTAYEVAEMEQACGMEAADTIRYGLERAEEVLGQFCREGWIREHISVEENNRERLLDRHINPGHTLEDVWFIYEYLERYGKLEDRLETLQLLARKAMERGWDPVWGGLLRFTDREGSEPQGWSGDTPYERLILDTWDMKLWWPQAEMLYTSLLLFRKTGRKEFGQWYQRVFDYAFSVFPSREEGEWIQIRKRDGSPQEKVVALPVKDPFHIMRSFIKIIELLVLGKGGAV